jgi:hypothetical protein
MRHLPLIEPTGTDYRGKTHKRMYVRTQIYRHGQHNEYFGITLERAAKILDALNVRLRTQVAIDPLPPFPIAQAS